MIRGFIFVLLLVAIGECRAQGVTGETVQQLEQLAENGQSDNIDEDADLIPERFATHPVNLNTAGAALLKELHVLNELQIAALLSYRQLLGPLNDICELQAIPSWDIATIKTLLPYVSVASASGIREETIKRLRGGQHLLLIRTSRVFTNKQQEEQGYNGSPLQLRFRYRYNYKGLLQYGITGDKDAGEQFFKGAQRTGFDFYSVHFYMRNAGQVQSLALGDFSVNMGQGLLLWQGMALNKGADVLGIKRQSPVLKPYNSSGEFYFSRGAGVTVKAGKYTVTVFGSLRKLNANTVTDSLTGQRYCTSFLTSGYNRTNGEAADKNAVRQLSYGGTIAFNRYPLQAAVNFVGFSYSLPLQKKDEPYNLYAIKGNRWANIGIDYSYTWRNIHFFGEAAADKNRHTAFVQGLMVSLHAKADLTLLYRHIAPAYRTVYGNAFTDNTAPMNEQGMYAGLSLRPAHGWKIDAYADISHMPWLSFNADAPSTKAGYFLQVNYKAGKHTELYMRYKMDETSISGMNKADEPNSPLLYPRHNCRFHISYPYNASVTLRSRVETVWYGHHLTNKGKGYLGYFDFVYKPMMAKWNVIARIQYHEITSYDARIYAYENDVQYSYSIPAYSGRGSMCYILINRDIGKHITCWLRLSRLVSADDHQSDTATNTSSKAGRQTQINLQLRALF